MSKGHLRNCTSLSEIFYEIAIMQGRERIVIVQMRAPRGGHLGATV